MARKLPAPRTWTPFKPSLCRSCWASCCHNIDVQVSVSDLIRMGLVGKMEAQSSLSSAVQRLQRAGILRKVRRGSFVFLLGQKRSGDCIFLNEERRCTVYAARPEICRQFPRIGPRPGHCPYVPKT